ncbi:MAG: hypothetical protein IJS62_09140 [Bacteroidales bacterium]|nr:hypothetical protein [Bacteroidales bacterium]
MKTRTLILFGASFSLLAACNTAELEPAFPEGAAENPAVTVLEASTAGDLVPDSRTAFGDKDGNTYPVLWSEGDCISVNGVASAPLASGGGVSAAFNFNALLDAPFQGVYPLSAVKSYAQGVYSICVPSGQTYVPGQYDPAAGIMLASGSGSLSFRHVMSYLKITVTGSGSEKIQFVSVSARGGEDLSGTFTPVFGAAPSLTGGTGGNAVTLDCGAAGVSLGTELIIPIPARTLASGLSVTVRTTDKKFCTMTSSASFAPVAGRIYKTSFAFEEKGSAKGIWTEEDLVAFLAAADGKVACSNYTSSKDISEALFGDYSDYVGEDGAVHIKADITLSSTIDWSGSAASRKNAVSNFDGILDGEGHTITIADGTSWKTPLFINLYGTIRNLKLAGNMTASHAATLGAPLVNVVQAGGVVSNVQNYADVTYNTVISATNTNYTALRLGGVAAYVFGTVQDCENHGAVTAGGTLVPGTNTIAYVGGVVSAINTGGLVTRCTNYGPVTTSLLDRDGKVLTNFYVGGVCGYVNYGSGSWGTINYCYNRAAELEAGTAYYLGGVVGGARSSGLSQLHNYCPITAEDDNSATSQMGGVTAFLGAGYTMSDCTNNASIYAGGCSQAGGVMCIAYGSMTNCVNNGMLSCADGQLETRLGGVCREVKSGATLTNCRNTADHVLKTTYYAGVTCLNSGTLDGCSNSGNISFGVDYGRLAGVVYDNSGTMTGCSNSGSISCDKENCNMAGVVALNRSSMTNCDNSGTITVTGNGSLPAGVCFNMVGGTIDGCDNSGDITVDVAPASAGEIASVGGIVGIVSKTTFANTSGKLIFPQKNDGRYGPAYSFTDNVLDAVLTIQNCTNTGQLKIISKPANSSVFLRNVAIGGIVGWNWAKSTDDYFLKVLNCTNGTGVAATRTKGMIDFEQAGASAYIGPSLGGIIGWSAHYNTSGNNGLLPYLPDWAQSLGDQGFKVWIEGCRSYARISNMASYSSTPDSPTERALRPCGGIAGVLYGHSTSHAVVKDCTSATYILMGTTGSGTATQKQSLTNCVGGIAGSAAFVDVSGCTINSSRTDTYGVGSESRYVFAAGGVFGAALEKFSVTDCDIHMRIGYMNNKDYSNWGLVAGVVTPRSRTRGYTNLMGCEISGNRILPGTVKVNNTTQTITESNFGDYLISAADAADNATNGWLTCSNNTWE